MEKPGKVKQTPLSLRVPRTTYDQLAGISERTSRSINNVASLIFDKALSDPKFLEDALSPKPSTDSKPTP